MTWVSVAMLADHRGEIVEVTRAGKPRREGRGGAVGLDGD